MINLYDLLDAANGQLFGEPNAQIFSGLSYDSRQAADSHLFVALKTDRGDGHAYMEEAVQRGATGLLCVRPPEFDTTGISVILVKDARAALMYWAHDVLGKLGTKVIGIAGGSGKTVAVEAISRVLSTRYTVLKSINRYANQLDLPLALADLTPAHQIAVLELETTQPGDMAQMVQAVRPEFGVIPHIGFGHTRRFDSPEQFTDECALLLEYLSPTGMAVLNYDDDRARELAARTRARTRTVGMEGFGADLVAYNIVADTTRTGFDLRTDDRRFVGKWTPLLGKHQLYSLLAAVALGMDFGISAEDALRSLTEMERLPGRMNPLPGINEALLIDDSYDAEPESTLAALDWLQTAAHEDHRAIFIMGDMDHLGRHSQRDHRIMGQRAAEFADLLVTHGPESAAAGRAAIEGGMEPSRVNMTHSVKDLVSYLQSRGGLRAGDIVLVKGGALARMERVTRALLADHARDASVLERPSPLEEPALAAARLSWVEIDLEALASNVRGIKALIGEHVTLFAVVKADAYGHGAVAVARTALMNGAEYLAVASINEAFELRDAGIDAPILVMSYTPPGAIRQAARQQITVTIYDLGLAYAYDRAAREAGLQLKAHVKVDTGMGRLGLLPQETIPAFRQLVGLGGLEIEGIYTHFSCADEDPEYTAEQVRVFESLLTPLRAGGINLRYVHAANSAGTLTSKANHFNAVRVGLALYGLSPSASARVPEDFEPVLSWKTVIAQVKTLPPGHPVGYGNTYRTHDHQQIAVIPIGYADGFRRAPNHWETVLVRGQVAPIVGRVSMEKTMIDVSHVPGVAIGDEVVLIGKQGDAVITANDIAQRWGTISYEVLCSALARVPRR